MMTPHAQLTGPAAGTGSTKDVIRADLPDKLARGQVYEVTVEGVVEGQEAIIELCEHPGQPPLDCTVVEAGKSLYRFPDIGRDVKKVYCQVKTRNHKGKETAVSHRTEHTVEASVDVWEATIGTDGVKVVVEQVAEGHRNMWEHGSSARVHKFSCKGPFPTEPDLNATAVQRGLFFKEATHAQLKRPLLFKKIPAGGLPEDCETWFDWVAQQTGELEDNHNVFYSQQSTGEEEEEISEEEVSDLAHQFHPLHVFCTFSVHVEG